MSFTRDNNYRQSVGRRMSRKQSDAEVPSMRMVSVAVLPPRLPGGMAPPSGIGASGAFGWDEAVNYQHNEPIQQPEPSKTKSLMRKAGLTTQRARKNPEMPPFTFRQVPYETWRKHYAKDAEGNYRGTHAPAQDCLLKPDDVQRWRFDEVPQTLGDKWTRGSEVLPVYAEVEGHGRVPEYYDVPDGEPTIENDPFRDFSNTIDPPNHSATDRNPSTSLAAPHNPATDRKPSKVIADGKTAQQIIEEAKNKPKPSTKESWKQKLKKGAEIAMMGN